MRIKKYFDSFFVLSKSERNGALVLFSIILILIIFRFMIPALTKNKKSSEFDFDQRIVQLEMIKDSLNKKNILSQNFRPTPSLIEVKKEKNELKEDNFNNISAEMFQFDPNRVTFEEMVRLGFPANAARNLINYREKGGIFHRSEELKKIYGVDSAFYYKLLPFIFIASVEADKKILIEINGADSATLTTLKGIGPVYASRICKYRKYLGGFVSLDQLKEVYQLPEETYLSIKEFLILDETKVEKIDINFIDIKELKRHPYCNYDLARKIIDYRSKKGYVKFVDQLLLDSVIEMSAFNRLSPYLKVQ